MAWRFSYEPHGPGYPNARVIEGNDSLQVVDDAPDGGMFFMPATAGFSGRRVRPESVPKVMRWSSRQPITDYLGMAVKTVSEALRELIEDLEPGVHQFEPVDFVTTKGDLRERRWFWQICNRLDTVHREKTSWVLDGRAWRLPLPGDKKHPWDKRHHVFDTRKIGHAQFWNDKHIINADFCSDEAFERINEADLTGFRFSYREEA
jgi:hypothetical protein